MAGLAAVMACLVTGIADGDTLRLTCDDAAGRATVSVRLAEIDAPEKGQPFGGRAKAHLARLCFGRIATVEPVATDRFSRTVARVECDGRDAGHEMLVAGLAWRFVRYSRDPATGVAEAQARAARVGLWHDESPVPPWEWRASRR